MVDYNGDPCAFTGICVRNSCLGRQGMGYGLGFGMVGFPRTN